MERRDQLLQKGARDNPDRRMRDGCCKSVDKDSKEMSPAQQSNANSQL